MWTPLEHRLSCGAHLSLQPPQAASITLGIDPEEMGDSSTSFNQLGGDSLAAIQFAREVDELCGTHLPVSFVLDHSHSMQDIVEKVSRQAHMHACTHAPWALCAGPLLLHERHCGKGGLYRHASMHRHAPGARLYHGHTNAGHLWLREEHHRGSHFTASYFHNLLHHVMHAQMAQPSQIAPRLGHDRCSAAFWVYAQVLSRGEVLHSKHFLELPTLSRSAAAAGMCWPPEPPASASSCLLLSRQHPHAVCNVCFRWRSC